MNSTDNSMLHRSACFSLIALIILIIFWELVLTPIAEQSVWPAVITIIKGLPLLLVLPGLLKKKIYTMQWSAMLILFYFIEGVVRSMSDINHLSRALAGGEIALSVLFFFSAIFYVRPFKKRAKAAKQVAAQTEAN